MPAPDAPHDHDQHDDHGHADHDDHDGHDHDHDDHGHEHGGGGLLARLKHAVGPHSHDAADSVDDELMASKEGTRALTVSLAGLAVTAIAQGFVVVLTGSIALLGDTFHNVADALTAVPLGIAFVLGRRAATRRYTDGYGRAEDLAGVFVVLAITLSAAFAGYESIRRLLDPRPVEHLLAVGLAGIVGFAGNELVARYRINVGRRIGSAALVADGLHARTDGFTSLAVVAGAIGVGLGFERADPIVGLLITAAILLVLRTAAKEVLARLMDAVDPALVDRAEQVLAAVPGVEGVGTVRLRWIGHSLHAEADVVIDMDRTLADSHAITESARHQLLHELPRLSDATIHADPCGHDGTADPHTESAHHRPT
jgi:cation diffusion facilitator family transporter